MKTYRDLYPAICTWSNLYRAARKAMKRKRYKRYVDRFWLSLENEMASIRRDLVSGAYQPGRYRHFLVTDPKVRLISAAPFRDRVVHHALCNVIEPVFERRFISGSYSCRVGKGTHKALKRCREFVNRYPYRMKLDIREYFDSIDHGILLGIIAGTVRCDRTLDLIDRILASHVTLRDHTGYFPGDTLFTPYERRRGLPIGNLTSQLFANLYLDGFDHFVKEKLKVKAYLRYTDDMVLFAAGKRTLWRWRDAMAAYLDDLRLRFSGRKTTVCPVGEGVEWLGFRVYPGRARIVKKAVGRFRKRMKRLWRLHEDGAVDTDRVERSVLGWAAHSAHGETGGLRRALHLEYHGNIGADQLLRPGSSGRFVEQQRT